MSQALIQSIRKKIDLSVAAESAIVSAAFPSSHQSKVFFQSAGQKPRGLFYVEEGCVKMYCLSKKGVEFISVFAVKDWWIGDIHGLSSDEPSNFYIETVHPSKVVHLSYAFINDSLQKFPELEKFWRLLFQNSLVANYRRNAEMLRNTAEERYDFFCQRYPDLVYTVTQKQIASYIGVTPEFMSKMLRDRIKNAKNKKALE